MTENARLGEILRAARHAKRLTLEDLAEQVGVTPGALSHVESGRRLPSPRNAVAIADALDLDHATVLALLDDAHSNRRTEAAYSSPAPGVRYRTAAPRAYRELPIEALFTSSDADRNRARWSPDTSERIESLDRLADVAADAIRTLRGLLHDEDPLVRREAQRLLRELDVRMPENPETPGR